MSKKIGILGGTYNPIHIGHLNSALTVKAQLDLEKVLIIPANTPPHREIVTGPGAKMRLKLAEIAANIYSPDLEASDLEVIRGGVSYSVDTLKQLIHDEPQGDFYLIMGADTFAGFDTWKDFEEITQLANLVVTSRPGINNPFDRNSWSPALQNLVKESSDKEGVLKSGKKIFFVSLEDIDVSSSEIRKRLRAGHDASSFLSAPVLKFIKSEGLYERGRPFVKDYLEFSKFCASRAEEKKALDLKVYDLEALGGFTDFAVICSGSSGRQTKAIAESIVDGTRQEYGLKPLSVEGLDEGKWVLVDFGATVIHVFEDTVRTQYGIEGLWNQGKIIIGNENRSTHKLVKATPLA